MKGAQLSANTLHMSLQDFVQRIKCSLFTTDKLQ